MVLENLLVSANAPAVRSSRPCSGVAGHMQNLAFLAALMAFTHRFFGAAVPRTCACAA